MLLLNGLATNTQYKQHKTLKFYKTGFIHSDRAILNKEVLALYSTKGVVDMTPHHNSLIYHSSLSQITQPWEVATHTN